MEVAATTALLLLPLLIAARRGLVPRPETVVPAIGAAAALNGQAVLRLSCHAAPTIWHPLLFHSAPVILVGAVCLLAAKLWSGLGRRQLS